MSDRGREEVDKIARAVTKKEPKVAKILHSGKVRARETAEILARYLSPPSGMCETKGLEPEDDPLLAKAELESAKASLMLVGHLPHLSRLVSLLVTGGPDEETVDFPAAAIVCLSHGGRGWKVSWTMDPASA